MGLRDKYKGASIKNIKKKRQEEKEFTGSGNNAEWHSIEKGSNNFRIFPPHNPNDSYDQIRVLWWLSREKDDGSRGQFPFPHMKNAGMKWDLVDKYKTGSIAFLEENDEDADAKIETIKDWKKGLSPSTSWVCYAKSVVDGKLDGDIKLLDYGKTVHDGMDDIMSTEEENESITVDPFSDPDDGLPICIKYMPEKKKAGDKYSVEIPRKSKAIPLSDDDLEIYDKMKPIKEQFSGFSMEMFDMLLASIELYDEDVEIGYFESDEFQDLIKDAKKMVKEFNESTKSKSKSKDEDEDDEDEEPKKKEKKKDKKKEKKKSKVEDEDEDDDEDEKSAPKKSEKKKPEPDEDEDEDDEDDENSLANIKNKLKGKK